MELYNLTLQRSNGLTCAVHGNFTGKKNQEIVAATMGTIGLYSVDDYGKLQCLCSTEVFGVVRCLKPFRTAGSSKDYVVVGANSGMITILEYLPKKNEFVVIQQETFGRSGIRRAVPGQYLAMDPKGRAVMIGAVEKQKFVYVLNRDSANRLTISSPLEAHRSHTFLHSVVGLDVGYENPLFVCLELDVEEAETDASGKSIHEAKPQLTYYELDLSLNHVVRKQSELLSDRANMLIGVPGSDGQTGGLLVCFMNYIIFRMAGLDVDIKCQIPRRRNSLDDADVMINSSAVFKKKDLVFLLVQTDQGDLFEVILEKGNSDVITEVKLKYYNTIPVATSLCILRQGFMFVAPEFGNAQLYSLMDLTKKDEPVFSSAMTLEQEEMFFFTPEVTCNLKLVDELTNLNYVKNAWMGDLTNEDSLQLYALCGQGPKSSLRILRHGLEVTEMAVTEMPGNPNGIWSLKKRETDEYHSYIVVSFSNATLVLSIGETIEEVTDSGFLGTSPTLVCSHIGENALVQVYPEAVRHIKADKRVNEWKAPSKKLITNCVVNVRQLVIALTGGELVYFEVDEVGQLSECSDRKDTNSDVTSMCLGPIPNGEIRTRFLGVGLTNGTVNIISLDPGHFLQVLSVQSLPSTPISIFISDMDGLYLSIGLENGTLLKSVLDSASGELSDTRTRYLGPRTVKFSKLIIRGSEAMLAMSSRAWLNHMHQNRHNLVPLSYGTLDYASGFSSEQCPEGIVAVCSNTLRVLTLENLGTVFNQTVIPLRYTPSNLAPHVPSGNVIIIESDHNALTEDSKKSRKEDMANEMLDSVDEEQIDMARDLVNEFLKDDLPENIYGDAKPGVGTWASIIRIVNPSERKTVFQIPLDQNESATSICLTQFEKHPGEDILVVGVQKDLILKPRTFGSASIHVYHLKEGGQRLELIHKTPLDEVANVICPYMGRVLIGVGRFLRLYDLGKKKMLRKCENKRIPNSIVDIKVMGERIVVSDVCESSHFLTYKADVNLLLIFADDFLPKHVVRSWMVDYHTVVASDKFGNIWVARLPSGAVDDVDEDPTGNKLLWDRKTLGGASQKLETICSYHVGEIVASIQKTTIVPGGSEVLLYITVQGTIGMLAPFSSKHVSDFFQRLEMHVRSKKQSLVGVDHLAYRSSFYPVQNVVDGDLCEEYNFLDSSLQGSIAEELGKTPSHVSKNLESLRTKYAF